jgi:hypothetical protein
VREVYDASCAHKFAQLLADEANCGRTAVSRVDGGVGLSLAAMAPVLKNLAEGNPKAVSETAQAPSFCDPHQQNNTTQITFKYINNNKKSYVKHDASPLCWCRFRG